MILMRAITASWIKAYFLEFIRIHYIKLNSIAYSSPVNVSALLNIRYLEKIDFLLL